MARELRVFLDLNVVLDVLSRREPGYRDSAGVWALIETGAMVGLVAAHSLTTLVYLLSRHAPETTAVAALRDLLSVFSVAAVDQDVILRALQLGWRDFEDAVQMAAAEQAGADYLVTRNVGDFISGLVPVIQPAELLALFEGAGNGLE
jgi:predicted nucleic acid-binding protein